MIQSVDCFNKDVIGIDRKPGTVTDKDEFEFMIGTIIEELKELREAHEEGDFVKELDAVTDLIYFGIGFFTRMGIPPRVAEKIFYAVHGANMTKTNGKKKRDIQHGLDAVKPEDWVGPEQRIMDILNEEFGSK